MTVRDFKIICPICQGTLVIDARNGKLIKHWEKDQKEEDEKPDPAEFDAALNKVDKMKKEGDSTFTDAIKKVSDRKKGLDDLFKEARDKAEDKLDSERPEDRDDFWD